MDLCDLGLATTYDSKQEVRTSAVHLETIYILNLLTHRYLSLCGCFFFLNDSNKPRLFRISSTGMQTDHIASASVLQFKFPTLQVEIGVALKRWLGKRAQKSSKLLDLVK